MKKEAIIKKLKEFEVIPLDLSENELKNNFIIFLNPIMIKVKHNIFLTKTIESWAIILDKKGNTKLLTDDKEIKGKNIIKLSHALSWKYIFNSELNRDWKDIESVKEKAMESGYKYFSYLKWIYCVSSDKALLRERDCF